MKLPDLRKGTSAAVLAVPQFGLDGTVLAVLIVKESFHVDRRGAVRRLGDAEVQPVDVPWEPDAPETSTTRLPCDVCIRKPATDVLVVGEAMSAYRAKQTELDVTVRVANLQRVLRVFGPRVWYRGALGMVPSEPAPFESVAVRWENAWGGADFTDPRAPLEEARNPAGRGLVRDPDTLEGALVPQVEDPDDLIESHRSRPTPAGLAPIGRHWLPRRQYTGTIDEFWMRERMPLLPADYDARFEQCAPPGMVVDGYLRGGEPVLVQNMCAEGPLSFELPRLHFFAGAKVRGRLVETPAALDTVLVLPNARRVELTWRAAIAMPRRAHEIEALQVHEKTRIA